MWRNILLLWVNTQRYLPDVISGFSRSVELHKGSNWQVTVESLQRVVVHESATADNVYCAINDPFHTLVLFH